MSAGGPFQIVCVPVFILHCISSGAIVIGVTILWQLYRRSKGSGKKGKKDTEADGFKGGGRYGRDPKGMREMRSKPAG